MSLDGAAAPRFGELLASGSWTLAIDTSGREGSIALGRSAKAEATATLAPRRHASDLVPELERLLATLKVSVHDLAGIIVGAGPGSFTGVRVAAATAKALCHALGVPLWPVSSLRGAACDPEAPWSIPSRGVLFDARGDRMYGAWYAITPQGVRERVAPFAADLDDALARFRNVGDESPPELGGSSVWRHRARLSASEFSCAPAPAGKPTATGLLEALRLDPDTGPHENPAQWEPEYLRASSAERSKPGIDVFDSGP